jgi:hypothetical protein
MTWKNISLGKYQQIDAINKQELPEIDKALYSACIVFDKTEYEIDNEKPKKVLKLMTQMQRLFESPFNPKPANRIGVYDINYDVSRITLGQYIEISFFIGRGPVDNAHYILASMAGRWRKKKITSDHRTRADYFLTQPVVQVIGAVNRIQENYSQFNQLYQKLFGVDADVVGNVQHEDFNKQYGWIYSATQVAQHEGISLDAAYALPVKQAFNDLLYLKAKGKYELEQLRNSKKII